MDGEQGQRRREAGLALGPGLFLGLALALSPTSGRADPPPVVEVPPIEVEGLPAPAPEAPASVVADPLERPEDLRTPQAPLRAAGNLPAVRLKEAGGPGQGQTLMVRGADPSGTLATLEGVPLNSPFLGGADLSGLGLVALDRLEVVRGGIGQEAIGGTLAAFTPDPLGGERRSRASVGGGSFGTFWMKGLHVQPLGSGMGLLVGAGARRADGGFSFVDSRGQRRRRDHAAAESLEGLFRLDGVAGQGHRWTFLAEAAGSDRQEPGLEQFPSETATQWDSRLILRASWNGPIPGQVPATGQAALFYRRLSFVYDDPAPPMGPPTASTLISHGVGARLRAEVAPWPVATFFGTLEGNGDIGSVHRLAQAPYHPRRWTLAGALGARIGRPTDPYEVFLEGRLLWAEGFGLHGAPRLGVLGLPGGPVRLFLNVSRAFRLPTLEELHYRVGFVQGNPDLRPEEAWTWDAGVEALWPDRGRIRAAYFENYLDNLILFLPRSAFLVQADNSGRATIRGVEALGEVSWRWLRLRATYTWLWSRFAATGLSLPDRPAHSVQGEIALTLGPVQLALLPGWQSSFFLDRFESAREEGRFQLDARLEWQFRNKVAVTLEARNLTDKRDAVDSLQRPLPGLSLFTQVSIHP